MSKTKKVNQGFSLIELLIAVTILSIVMIMVVQFMSTSSAAYRKTKKNLSIQTEAMKVMEQMSDTLMQANYIRIMTKDKGMYEISQDDVTGTKERKIELADDYTEIEFDFVPDSYGSYARLRKLEDVGRAAIVNFDTYEIVNEVGKVYPLSTDFDNTGGADTVVRSFRMLKPGEEYRYVKPEFIYAEYYRDSGETDDTTGKIIYNTVHVLYYITGLTDTRKNTCSIYMMQYETANANSQGFGWARIQMLNKVGGSSVTTREDANTDAFTEVEENIDGDIEGLVTDKLMDFYLTTDVDGNALLTNILFADDGYEYNVVETINFRNSNVLTVRPQKLFKVKGTGNADSGVADAPEEDADASEGDASDETAS